MTGEVTLRGNVLPIGGLKEKLLAAKRAGIKTVIVPKRNKKDLNDVPAHVRRGLHLVFAETMNDVLKNALKKKSGPGRAKKQQPKSKPRRRRALAHPGASAQTSI